MGGPPPPPRLTLSQEKPNAPPNTGGALGVWWKLLLALASIIRFAPRQNAPHFWLPVLTHILYAGAVYLTAPTTKRQRPPHPRCTPYLLFRSSPKISLSLLDDKDVPPAPSQPDTPAPPAQPAPTYAATSTAQN